MTISGFRNLLPVVSMEMKHIFFSRCESFCYIGSRFEFEYITRFFLPLWWDTISMVFMAYRVLRLFCFMLPCMPVRVKTSNGGLMNFSFNTGVVDYLVFVHREKGEGGAQEYFIPPR